MIRPDWPKLAPLIVKMAAELADATPEQVAFMDQAGAAARDHFDELGVSLADPDAIYCGLVFMVEFVGRLGYGMRTGLIPAEAAAGVVACMRGTVAAVLPFVPDEARR